MKSRLGIDRLDRDRVIEKSFPSSFDFKNQVIIGIPVNTHSPDHPLFSATLNGLVTESLRTSQGQAFVLFTIILCDE